MYEKILKYLKPYTIVFFQGNDFISQAIIACQNIYTKEKFNCASQWSHIGFIGTDGKFYESTISIGFFKIKHGIKISDVSKRFSKNKLTGYGRLGFQFNFPKLSYKDWDKMTLYGQNCKRKKIGYGTLELFGTLWTLICWKFSGKKGREKLLREKNPFDSVEKVYCIAFVSDAITSTGKKYISVEPSVSTVDEAWLKCQLGCEQESIRGV